MIKRAFKLLDTSVGAAVKLYLRTIWRLEVKFLGLKEGNIYAPSWSPNDWDRIISIEYPYVVSVGLRKVDGGHQRMGGSWQSDAYGYWIEHTFVKSSELDEYDREWLKEHKDISL